MDVQELYPVLSEERLLSLDVYDLAWYAYYVMAIYGKDSTREVFSEIDLKLKAYLAEGEESLFTVLYDKEFTIGILLGYYVLLRSGFYKDQHVRRTLTKILEYVDELVDRYSSQGEVLFVLKKLTEVTDATRGLDVNIRMKTTFRRLRNGLLWENLYMEQVEDLLYLVWAMYESRRDIDNRVDVVKVILDERLHRLALSDFRTKIVYANALANFILKRGIKKMSKREHNTLRKKVKEVVTSLEHDLKMLNQIGEGVSVALWSKAVLGLYSLEKALGKVQELNEVWRIKIKYGTVILSLAAVVSLTLSIPQIANLLHQFHNIIFGILMTIIGFVVDDMMLGGRLPKWLKSFFKHIMKFLSKLLK